MKKNLKIKTLFLIAILCFNGIIVAQINIFGMTEFGGDISVGNIFTTDENVNNQVSEHSFYRHEGAFPNFSDLCEASNGLLYGVTQSDGANNSGVLFSYNHTTYTYTKLLDFIGPSTGSSPQGSLLQASNGLLYGMTVFGGINDMGVLFSFNVNTFTYSKLYDFSGVLDGALPYGSLIEADNGLLYGMTRWGGINNKGVLFSYNLNTATFTKLLDFNGASNGSNPYGNLMQASNGLLYGMTYDGGINNMGVLFSFNPVTLSYTKLIDFSGVNNGSNPYSSLKQANNGLLYGMTYGGGINNMGVLFSFNPTTFTYTKLIDFNGASNGKSPKGNIIQAGNGLLYGMTGEGGSANYGVIYSYNPFTHTYIKLIDFNTNSGAYPFGSLIQASNGLLYGMTHTSAAPSMGTIFSYDATMDIYTKLISFRWSENGIYPNSSLIQASDGLLYGMTTRGGLNHQGVLFKYNPLNLSFSKLFDFEGAINGGIPMGNLIQANNGLLYGMTREGGLNNLGVIFSYNLFTSEYIKLFDFSGNANGRNPYGSLIQANDGLLYGMAYGGGLNNMGVLFSFNPTNLTFTKLIDFSGESNGSNPYGNLIQANNGSLYGMTYYGGANNKGILFSFNPLTLSFNKLIDFNGAINGENPHASLMQANNGLLYAMTSRGGINNFGVLFSYNPTTFNYTKLLDFDGVNTGRLSQGNLIQASNGKLYGMTTIGGINDLGVIFEYDYNTNTYTKKLDFNGSNGKMPKGDLIEVNNCNTYSYLYINSDSSINVVSPSGNYIWTLPGIYVDTIANTAGCDSIFTVNLTLGTSHVATNNAFWLYPNPTKSNVTITGYSQNAEYKLLDFMGKVIIKGIATDSKIEIDISSQPAGIYLFIMNESACKIIRQ